MNVDELRSVLRTERQRDSLQQLRESFYEDVAEFIAEKKAQRQRTAEELGTHYSPEIRRVTDEIETAEEVVTSIYERRVGKVVKTASFAAAGMSADTDGLTHEEKRLFDDLVARIERNRSTVLSTLEDGRTGDGPATSAGTESADAPTPAAGEAPASPADTEETATPSTESASTDATPTDAGAADVLADAMGGGADDGTAAETDAAAASTGRPADEATTVSGSGSSGTGTDEETTTADRAPDDGAPATPPDEPEGDAEVDVVSDDPLSALSDDRATVRITADVGTIFGVDEREYDLAEEDVVTLPAANADPLVDRGAAERLD